MAPFPLCLQNARTRRRLDSVHADWTRAPWLDHSMTEPPGTEEPAPAVLLPAADVAQRTSMAAERTWLAWWRTALAASVGALGVGRLAPEVLDVATWPYVVLGTCYAVLSIGLLLV